MALGANLNAIDADRAAIQAAEIEIAAQRQIIRTSRTSESSLIQALEADIRDANTNGLVINLTTVFEAGFLDAVPDGTIQTFSRNNATRRLTFQYDKDADQISGITYETGTFEVGDL